jgi:GDP-L-fucose synthase
VRHDLTDANMLLMKFYSDIEFLSVGTGGGIPIADFVAEVANVVGYKGMIVFDTSCPDGTPQKLLNIPKNKKARFVTGDEAS